MNEDDRIKALENRIAELESKVQDKVALVVFSDKLDRALAAFIIATGAAALGMQVTMFFTFWGLNILKQKRSLRKKTFLAKIMDIMSPKNSKSLPLSQMNYFGAGAFFLRKIMKSKNVASIEELIALAKELGIHMIACEMTRDLLGIENDELIPGFESGGVATFLSESLHSRTSLFI